MQFSELFPLVLDNCQALLQCYFFIPNRTYFLISVLQKKRASIRVNDYRQATIQFIYITREMIAAAAWVKIPRKVGKALLAEFKVGHWFNYRHLLRLQEYFTSVNTLPPFKFIARDNNVAHQFYLASD